MIKVFPTASFDQEVKVFSQSISPFLLAAQGGSASTKGNMEVVEMFAWVRLAGVACSFPKYFPIYCISKVNLCVIWACFSPRWIPCACCCQPHSHQFRLPGSAHMTNASWELSRDLIYLPFSLISIYKHEYICYVYTYTYISFPPWQNLNSEWAGVCLLHRVMEEHYFCPC